MLDLLKQKAGLSGETVPVSERPAVLEATGMRDADRATRDEAKRYLDQIELVLAPVTDSASVVKSHVDEATILRASAALPQARLSYLGAEAQLKDSERELQRVVQTETRNVTAERGAARRSLIKELFGPLDIAVAMAEEIQAYDDETRRLGGVPPPHAVPELLSDTYRQNFVEANRSVLMKEGWL
ncbi:MAG: hypothetical protein H8K07_20395 [Nitrospira sp.]|nr:hypothetical protein [Nitrospira sp.]